MFLNSRLAEDAVVALDRSVPRYLDLHEVIIVGNNGDQVCLIFMSAEVWWLRLYVSQRWRPRPLQIKFSEMTLDMFRILQAVEYEPQEDLLEQRQTDASIVMTSPRPAKPQNPVCWCLVYTDYVL